jgi:hypothetical protein
MRTALISYAESNVETIAKYADLLMDMKTPATNSTPLVNTESKSITDTLLTIMSYMKQGPPTDTRSRSRERKTTSDSKSPHDKSTRSYFRSPSNSSHHQ